MGMDASAHTTAIIEKVRKDNPNVPFYRQLDLAARLPDRYDPDAIFGRGSFHDDMVQAKYGASIQFHNWTVKLIHRLRKYQGIEVLGAPMIAEDLAIDRMDMLSLEVESALTTPTYTLISLGSITCSVLATRTITSMLIREKSTCGFV